MTVIDENQRLLGIVPRVALLNSMADPGPATGEIPPVQEASEPVVVSPSAAESDSEDGAAFTDEQATPTEVADASADVESAAGSADREPVPPREAPPTLKGVSTDGLHESAPSGR